MLNNSLLAVLVIVLAGIFSAGFTNPGFTNPGFTNPGFTNRDVLPKTVAFVDVTVIPMDRERMLEHQTVIVKGDRIVKTGESKRVKVPKDATVIDGRGRYLIPGLADMHAHLPGEEGQPMEMRKYLRMNVMCGVTMLRSMRGAPSHLAMRDSVRKGLLLSPSLYLSSPVLTRDTAFTAAKAEVLIRQYKKEGYDFVKYLTGLKPALFDSVAAIARREKMPLVGHVPQTGVPGAISAGMKSVEHMMPFVNLWRTDSANFKVFMKQMADQEIYSCPNVFFCYVYFHRLPVENLRQLAGIQHLSASLLNAWNKEYADDEIEAKKKGEETFRANVQLMNQRIDMYLKLLKPIHDSGVKLLVSASDGRFIVPGYGMAEEMKIFASAGLTPYEVLRAATVNAASLLREQQEWGTISKGKRADMVLLSENPLRDISAVEKIEGVMLRGQWIDKAEIEKNLDE